MLSRSSHEAQMHFKADINLEAMRLIVELLHIFLSDLIQMQCLFSCSKYSQPAAAFDSQPTVPA